MHTERVDNLHLHLASEPTVTRECYSRAIRFETAYMLYE